MASIFSWHHFTFQRQPSVLITSHKLTKPSLFQRCSYSSLYWQIAFIFHITLSILQYQDTPVVSWHIVPTLATNLCRLLATSLSVLWLLDTPTATCHAVTISNRPSHPTDITSFLSHLTSCYHLQEAFVATWHRLLTATERTHNNIMPHQLASVDIPVSGFGIYRWFFSDFWMHVNLRWQL